MNSYLETLVALLIISLALLGVFRLETGALSMLNQSKQALREHSDALIIEKNGSCSCNIDDSSSVIQFKRCTCKHPNLKSEFSKFYILNSL